MAKGMGTIEDNPPIHSIALLFSTELVPVRINILGARANRPGSNNLKLAVLEYNRIRLLYLHKSIC